MFCGRVGIPIAPVIVYPPGPRGRPRFRRAPRTASGSSGSPAPSGEVRSSMSKRSQIFRLLPLGLVAAAAVLAPSTAHASGYLAARFGSDYGTPAMANPYAIYFNPAAMGGTTGTQLTGDLSLLIRHASYTRPASALSPNASKPTDANYAASNTGTSKLNNLIGLPFLGVTSDLGTKNFRAGYAFYIPFGGQASWDKRDGLNSSLPGAVDGPQRWHNISGIIVAAYNTFAASYTIPSARLSFGASVSPIIHHVSTVRARNSDGSDDTNAGSTNIEGRSLIQATGVNLGAAAGVYWEAIPNRLNLGLSYTSQPGFGETRMKGTLSTRLGTQPGVSKSDIDFLQEYPDIVRFGSVLKISEKADLRADFEYVRWSTFKNQCVVARGKDCNVNAAGGQSGNDVIINIPRNWKDAVGFRIGPGYKVAEKTDIFGSLGFTTPAVPKSTIDSSTIDAFRIYIAAGVRHEISKHVALAGSYNHIAFLNVDSTNEAQQFKFQAPSKSPSGGGIYKSQVGLINVNVTYSF